MIHGFIQKFMMYLIVTYCNKILIIYMNGQPLITCFNAQKFHYITFSSKESSCLSNVYIHPKLNIINPSSEVLDLGVYMLSNCTFDFHVSCVYKRCSNLSGWILRTFNTRETRTLFKSLVLSWLDYASQLWSPHLIKSVYLLEKVQHSFTTHIAGMHTMSYEERLKHLNLYSIQRRRDQISNNLFVKNY